MVKNYGTLEYFGDFVRPIFLLCYSIFNDDRTGRWMNTTANHPGKLINSPGYQSKLPLITNVSSTPPVRSLNGIASPLYPNALFQKPCQCVGACVGVCACACKCLRVYVRVTNSGLKACVCLHVCVCVCVCKCICVSTYAYTIMVD